MPEIIAPRVQSERTSHAKVNATMFGVGRNDHVAKQQLALADGINKAGDAVAEYQNMKSEAKLQNSENELMDGLDAIDREARSQTLGNADNLTIDTEKKVRELENKVMEGLKGREIEKFKATVMNRQSRSMLSGIANHERGQMQKYDDVTFEQGATIKRNRAVASYNNEEKMMENLLDIHTSNVTYAKRKGLGNDWIKNQNLKDETIVHKTVIDSLREQSPEEALSYMDKYKKRLDKTMDPATRDALRLDVEARVQDNAWVAEGNEAIQKGVTYDDKMAELAERYEGEELEKAEASVGGRFVLAERIKNKKFKEARSDYDEAVIANGYSYIGLDGEDYKSMRDKLSPADQLTIENARRRELKNVQESGDRYAKANNADRQVYEDVYDQIQAGDISDPNMIEQHAPYLTKGQVNTLRNEVRNMKTLGPNASRNAYKTMLSGDNQTHAKWNDDTKDDFKAFSEWATDKVREDTRPQDIEDLAAQWFLEGSGKKDTFMRDDPDTYGEALQAERDDFIPDDIEAESIEQAQLFLTEKGSDLAVDADDWLDVQRVFKANRIDQDVTPEFAAAYRVLKSQNMQVTPEALEQFVNRNFK